MLGLSVCGPYAAQALHFAFKGKQVSLMLRGFQGFATLSISRKATLPRSLIIFVFSVLIFLYRSGLIVEEKARSLAKQFALELNYWALENFSFIRLKVTLYPGLSLDG